MALAALANTLRDALGEGGVLNAAQVGERSAGALHISRSPEEVAIMRSIKEALDPLYLLNPGKIFDACPPFQRKVSS